MINEEGYIESDLTGMTSQGAFPEKVKGMVKELCSLVNEQRDRIDALENQIAVLAEGLAPVEAAEETPDKEPDKKKPAKKN